MPQPSNRPAWRWWNGWQQSKAPRSTGPSLGLRGTGGMTRARSRLRDRRRGGLRHRFDHGRRLGRDDGKRRGARGMRHRGGRDRAGRRHVGILRHEAGHHQAADHHEIFQDKHHFPLGPQGPPQSLVAATAGLVQPGPARAPKSLCQRWGRLAAGGMVSNHRLVLFTHALCRLSYPAVGGKLPDPTAAVCAKLLTL